MEGKAGEPRPRSARKSNDERRRTHARPSSPEIDLSLTHGEEEEEFEMEEGGQMIEGVYVPPPSKPALTLKPDGPRLMITSVHSENFRSYGGVHHLGPLHHNFTSVVGPNGSGKSNFLDSILFVFGVKASRIRCKKVGDLVHRSDQLKSVNSCKVTVCFSKIMDRPDGGFDVCEGSEFNVSRTAYRDCSSYYELNGKRCSYKEITSFLMNENIDLAHNRFLILQGEIEKISLMKPKAATEHESGLLEYLEDVIGTCRYKKPLKELGEKLVVVEQETDLRLTQVKNKEKEMSVLKEPMRKALNYLHKHNEMTETQNVLYQFELREVNRKIEDVEQKKTAVETESAELRQNAADAKKAVEGIRKELLDQEKKISAHLEKTDKAKEFFHAAEGEDHRVQQQGKEIAEKLKATGKGLDKLEKNLVELREKPALDEAAVKDLEEKIEKAKEDVEPMRAELVVVSKAMEAESANYKAERDKLDAELSAPRDAYQQCKYAMDIAAEKLNAFVLHDENEKQKLEKCKSEIENTKTKLAETTDHLRQTQDLLKSKSHRLPECDAERSELMDKEEEAAKELRGLQDLVIEKKKSMKQLQRGSAALQALMKEKDSGRIPGILGRMGDLGAIDKKFDIAIATACSHLDYILVDTTETGRKCIDFIKQKSLPRTNFLALDKQVKFAHQKQRPIDLNNDAPRVFDLIQVKDTRVLPAFYFSLQETLVVDRLDRASELAYGSPRYRVVTTRGDLIELSGTMSGGGRPPMGGKMGQQVMVDSHARADRSLGSVETMEQKIFELQNKLNDIRTSLRQVNAEHDTLTKEIPKLEMAAHKLKTDIESAKILLPTLTRQLAQQTQKVKETTVDAAMLKTLQSDVDGKKKEFDKAEAKKNEVEQKVKAAIAKLENKTYGRDKELREAINKLEKSRAKMEAQIRSIRSAAAIGKKKLIKMEQELEEMSQRKVSLKEEAERVKQLRADVEKKAGLALNEYETLKNGNGELLKVKDEISERCKQAEQKHVEMEKQLVEIGVTIGKLMDELHALEPRKRDCDKRLKKLKLYKIPDDTEEGEPELRTYNEDELQSYDFHQLQKDVKKMEESLRNEKPNLQVLENHATLKGQFVKLVDEFDKAQERNRCMRDAVELMRTRRTNEFMAGFQVITQKLSETYYLITLGGAAELELVDSMDPFTEGVNFTVRPPKKTWKNITQLSGGEKTLSSLALVFALHYYRPTPFYVLDEIDAALDFKNVSIVATYIKDETKNAQFLVISHRSQMFEVANRMLGLYKVNNVTGVVIIDPELVFQRATAIRHSAERKALSQETGKRSSQHDAGRELQDAENEGDSSARGLKRSRTAEEHPQVSSKRSVVSNE
ncbi:unnamed protein product [Notodromas monacha]|uniref:Structural maintenance of chromosomes protein n=1 Tax=Notodromas monacha TaxID=399045 RepID=A0A7R9BVG5_9CRUS|nr:unnamed protein product [Notodromas monacha]CAG0921515.1 unnamed protein product [Notodromas monacha]